MARIEWVEDRLRAWAVWRIQRGSCGTGYPRRNILATWWTPPRGREADEARIPVDDILAALTDRAIARLDVRLRDTVDQHYLTSGSIADDARALGCSVSTVHARLSGAHRQLRDLLDTRPRDRSPDPPGWMRERQS